VSHGGVWRLAFLGHETKNEDPINAILPTEAGEMLDEYIRTYRPLLLHGPSHWVFTGQKPGSAKRKDTLGKQITKGILDFTGLVVNPHLLRHICSKLYLQDHPGAYGVVRLAVSHRSINTTIDNYCGSEGVQALAHYDAHILALRAQARARKPAAPARRRGR
jgi:integrase